MLYPTDRGGRSIHPSQATPLNLTAGCQNLSRICTNIKATISSLSTICCPFFRTRDIKFIS